MDFELVPALIAGLTGTVAMTAMMMMGKSVGMTSMDIALITGGMMTDDEAKARKIGMMLHIVMMGTIVFGIAYALLFQAFDSTSAATGLLIGAIHGVVVGAMAMPMMGAIHPRMQAAGQGFHLASPGFMGVQYGKGTPAGLVMGHAIYGLVGALVYGALI